MLPQQADGVDGVAVAEVAVEAVDVVVVVDAEGDEVSKRGDEDKRLIKKDIITRILDRGWITHVWIEKSKVRELCSLKEPEIDHVQQGPRLDWFWNAQFGSMRGRQEDLAFVNRRKAVLFMAKCNLIPRQ